MSTTNGDGEEKIEYMTDIADVLVDKTLETPAVNEVAVAAADSWPPVAALQYAIDWIHYFTGLNWWASIGITTVAIRTLLIPVMINQLKTTSKLTILKPDLEKIKEEMQAKGMSPTAVAEGQEQMKRICKEHGVSTFSPLKGVFIQTPVFFSFFFAIENMVEKVPSFHTGGISWFIDLATADSFYILPSLAAFTFWMTVEFNTQEGMEGNPNAGKIKKVGRVFAALSLPFLASFPTALFCYWITSNLFSLVYGQIIKRPSVKKILNIPIIIPPPPSLTGQSKPAISFFEALKKYAAAQAMQQQQQAETMPAITNQTITSSSLLSQKPSSEEEKNQRVPSSSVLSHRIKNLEKKVKGRKKKKRM